MEIEKNLEERVGKLEERLEEIEKILGYSVKQ